jgi:hypothetical protein
MPASLAKGVDRRYGGSPGASMSHFTIVALAIALVLTGVALLPAADWTVQTVARTDGPGSRCVLESSRQQLLDGYQKTTASIAVMSRSVAVTSQAPLDSGFSDIGLVVDQGEFIPMDRLDGPKTALFESRYDRVIEQFKAGREVRVQLRFWPTWPATGAHSAKFSLIGFTRAYGQLAGCR